MSKKNWLRAKINREAESRKNVSAIFSKTWRMWFYVYYAPKHYRSFKTWKHNRKQQFKIHNNGNN